MYTVNSIRNICLLGHSGSGKTALAESLLYMTGAIDRIGKNADGNTVCDYDPEEIRRHISISTSVVPLEYHNVKINLLDTPGAFDFSGAVMEALRAADAAILVCSAKDGITVGFEKAWKYCEDRNMPRFVYISKVDEDNSDYNATFNALREKYGNKIAPVVIPIWNSAHKVTGIIDVLNKRAYEMQNLKRVEIDVPADKVSVIEEFNDALKEAVAETDEALMEKYFENPDSLTEEEIIAALVEQSPVPLAISDQLPQGVQAQYVPKQRTIYVRNGMDETATICAIAREQAHAGFDTVGSGYYRQAYAPQAYCAAYVVAHKLGLDTSAFHFDKVCQTCAGMEVQEKKGFISDVKRAAYAINREMQRSFREMEQTIQPDEFSVESPKPAKTPKAKEDKEKEAAR